MSRDNESLDDVAELEANKPIRRIKPEKSLFPRLANNLKKLFNQEPFTDLPGPLPNPGLVTNQTGYWVWYNTISAGIRVTKFTLTDGTIPVVTFNTPITNPATKPYAEVGREVEASIKCKCACEEQGACVDGEDGKKCEDVDYNVRVDADQLTGPPRLCQINNRANKENVTVAEIDSATLSLNDNGEKILNFTWTPTEEHVTENPWTDLEKKDGTPLDYQFVISFPNDSVWTAKFEVVEDYDDIPDKKKNPEIK